MQYEHYVIRRTQPPYTRHIPTTGSNRIADVQSSEELSYTYVITFVGVSKVLI